MKTLKEVVFERILHDGRTVMLREYIFSSSDSEDDIKRELWRKHPEALFKYHTDTGIPAVKRTLADINDSIQSRQRECFKEHKLWKASSGFWGNYCVYAVVIEDIDNSLKDLVYENTKHWTDARPSKADYNNVIKTMEKKFVYIDEYRIMVRSTYYENQFDPEPTGIDSVHRVATIKKDLEVA